MSSSSSSSTPAESTEKTVINISALTKERLDYVDASLTPAYNKSNDVLAAIIKANTDNDGLRDNARKYAHGFVEIEVNSVIQAVALWGLAHTHKTDDKFGGHDLNMFIQHLLEASDHLKRAMKRSSVLRELTLS